MPRSNLARRCTGDAQELSERKWRQDIKLRENEPSLWAMLLANVPYLPSESNETVKKVPRDYIRCNYFIVVRKKNTGQTDRRTDTTSSQSQLKITQKTKRNKNHSIISQFSEKSTKKFIDVVARLNRLLDVSRWLTLVWSFKALRNFLKTSAISESVFSF